MSDTNRSEGFLLEVSSFWVNSVHVVGDPTEVSMYFGRTVHRYDPNSRSTSTENRFVCRVSLSPSLVKNLITSLQGYLDHYEATYGRVPELPKTATKTN